MNLLEEILENKRRELEAVRDRHPLEEIRAAARQRPPPGSLVESLRSAPMGLIAEVKHRSPSAGMIRVPFDPAAIARDYASAGAQGISVLVDADYFGGGPDDLRAVSNAVGTPVLYKEFVVSPWQIWHARALGASAVLLIAAALVADELAAFLDTAAEAGVEPLVEVHNRDELHTAVHAGATFLGINNRDLRTFATTLDTTRHLAAEVPDSVTLVSESGIRTSADVAEVREAGAHAVLVGEQLLRQRDLPGAVRSLMGEVWASS